MLLETCRTSRTVGLRSEESNVYWGTVKNFDTLGPIKSISCYLTFARIPLNIIKFRTQIYVINRIRYEWLL